MAIVSMGVAACGDGQEGPSDIDDAESVIDDDLGPAPDESDDPAAPPDDEPDPSLEEPVDESAPEEDERDDGRDADGLLANQRGLRAGPFVDHDGFQYYLRAGIEWQPADNDPLRANPGETNVGQDLAARLVVENAMDDRVVRVGMHRTTPEFAVYGTFDADRPICQVERFSETQVGRGYAFPWVLVAEDSCAFPYGMFSPESLAAGDDRMPEIMPGEEISASGAYSLGSNLHGVTEAQGEELTEDLDAGPDGIAVLVGSGTLDDARTPMGRFDRACFDSASGVPRSGVQGRIIVLAEATFEGDSRIEEVAGCS